MLLTGLPDSCSGCPLSTNQKCGKFTKISGKGTSGVMIIGEASGEHEAQEGRPFIEWAPSGSILEKAIRLGGKTRDDFWLTNIVRCRPPNNILAGADYEHEAISHCSQYLKRAIEELKPRAILALGSLPTRELTGFSGGKRSISYTRGYILPGPSGLPTVPSYHPAFISRGNTRLIGVLIKDLATARSAATGRVSYVIDPSEYITAYEGTRVIRELYEEARKDPDMWIAYDIETPQSQGGIEDDIVEFEEGSDSIEPRGIFDSEEIDLEDEDEQRGDDAPNESSSDDAVDSNGTSPARILSIQFAISPTSGVFGRWQDPEVKELTKLIMGLPNPKVAHNGNHFDRPRLEREGIIIHGEHYDSLPMRKALQPDLPAGLQQVAVDYGFPFPWKHYSGSDDVLYGVCDVCSLVQIVSKLPMELDNLGMWEGFQRYIKEVGDKVFLPWEKRGIPMSVPRLDDFRSWLTSQVSGNNTELISAVPSHLHKKHPEQGYKDIPDRVKDWLMLQPEIQAMFEPTYKKYKNGKEAWIKSKTKISDVYRLLSEGHLPHLLSGIMLEMEDLRHGMFDGIPRLYQFVPFNPRSSKQMIDYIKFKISTCPEGKYEVPKTFKDGKETTADKPMRRLQEATKDVVIKLSREIRALEKMRDSYTGKVGPDGIARGGWIPDPDGNLRTRAKTNSTWQVSSVSPNVFTLPKKRKELADRFRRCVAAKPGHVMIEFDYKAFHDLTTASLANDERKWRTAKLDPHSYVAGWLVKYPGIETALSLSDADLKLLLKEIRARYEKVRDEQAKPLNHGTNFGQSYRRLYFENEEFFESEKQAKDLMAMLKGIYPKTFKWQEELLQSLDTSIKGKVPFLQSVWGARRWFWDVWVWKRDKWGRWYKAKGQDAEKALAFLPANHAHGMFRMKMLEMAEAGWLERYQLINFPHDALVFHPPIELADECISNVKEWMELPVRELANPILCPEGFSCGVDAKIGPDLADMKEVH